jgi:hypothetical protein
MCLGNKEENMQIVNTKSKARGGAEAEEERGEGNQDNKKERE